MLSGSGTNIKMFDYMSVGLPIVTTDVGARGIPNLVPQSFLLCSNNSESLLENINKIKENPSLGKSLGGAARNLCANNFDFSKISFELGCLLKERVKAGLNNIKPFFSIIIPSYNRPDNLNLLLQHIAKQNFKDFEILIIDQSDIEINLNVPDVLTKKCSFIHSKIKGAAPARNLGAYLSNGEVLAFTDDDCIPDDEWLENAFQYFRLKRNVGLEGKIYPDIIDSKYRVVSNLGMNGLAFMTANLFVRKNAFETIGGFDLNFNNPHFREDTDLGWRLLKLGEVPFSESVKVLHPSHLRTNERESEFERNKFFIQDPLLLQKHPELYVKLILKEGHYQKEIYWKYFYLGMIRYNINFDYVSKVLKNGDMPRQYIPNWLGGELRCYKPKISEVSDHGRIKLINKMDLILMRIKYKIKISFYSKIKKFPLCDNSRYEDRESRAWLKYLRMNMPKLIKYLSI